MNPTRLVCVSSLIATWLLFPDVALAQTATTSTSDIEPSVKDRQDAQPSTNLEPLRLPTQLAPDSLAQRIAPGPWLSTVQNGPQYVRMPALYAQQAVALAPQSPPVDPAMESRFVARRTVAGILIGLSSPFLVSGIALFVDASSHPSDDLIDPLTVINAGENILGTLSFLVGLSLAIPGLYMAVTDPPRPEGISVSYRPKLHVGPGSVGLSMSF